MTSIDTLLEQATLASTILEHAPIAVVVLDERAAIRYVNPYIAELTGRPADSVVGKSWFSTFLPPQERAPTQAIFDAAIGGVATQGNVTAVVTVDGREIPLEWYDQMLVADGTVIGLLALGIDVSARLAQAEALARQEQFLSEVSDAIVMTDLAGVITQVNARAELTSGYSADELVGEHVGFLFSPERWEALEQELVEPLPRQGEHHTEATFRTRSGEERIVDLRLRLLYDGDGAPTGMAGISTDVTETRLAQRAVAESEARLRRVLDTMFAFVAILSPDGVVIDANQAPFAASGLPRETTLGRPLWDTPFAGRSDVERERLVAAIRSAARGEPARIQTPIDVGQALLTFDSSFTPLTGEGGEVTEIVAFGVDVTDRLRVEHALRSSEEWLRAATAVFGVGIFEYDFTTATLHWSPEQRANYGVGPDTPLDDAFHLAHVHPDDRDRLQQALEAGADPRGDGQVELEYRILRDDGAVRWLLLREQIEFEGEGDDRRPVRGVGAEVDVTERRQAEDALRTREERLRQAESVARLGHFAVDRGGANLFVSDGLRAIFGIAPDVPVALADLLDRIHPDDRAEQVAYYRRSAPVVTPVTTEYRVVRPDGAVLVVTSVVDVQHTAEGSRYFGTVVDVTEQRRAEELVQRTAAELAAAQQMAHIGSWELDLVSGELRWTDEIFRIFEIDRAHFGASYEAFLEQIHPDDRALVDAAHTASLERHEPYSVTHRLLMADGRLKHVHEYGETDYAPDGRPLRSRGTVQDVTDVQMAEQEVRALNDELELRVERRTAQLASANRELEMFTYSVSHDLKAPLRSIDGYSRLLVEDHADSLDEEGLVLLGNVRRAAALMNELIDDLLAYSRLERQELAEDTVQPAELVDSILADRADEIRARGVAVVAAVDPVELSVDREGLVLALRNLVDNALKFLGDKPSPAVSIDGHVEGGKYVIRVRDNGIGFDMRFHDRIFEVFQRLHRSEDFPGTGIGLAIVRRAVERMGGSVRAESAPDAGATFTVELPL